MSPPDLFRDPSRTSPSCKTLGEDIGVAPNARYEAKDPRRETTHLATFEQKLSPSVKTLTTSPSESELETIPTFPAYKLQALNELLADLKAKKEALLASLPPHIAIILRMIDRIDEKLAELEERIGYLENRVDAIAGEVELLSGDWEPLAYSS